MKNFKSAIILAGGKSTRMNFDKQLLIINEEKLIESIASKLERSFEEIIIVSNKKEYYQNSKYKIVSDEIKDVGPLGGMHAGLKHSSSKYVYIMACDMPIVNNNYIEKSKDYINSNIIKGIEVDIYLNEIHGKVELFHGFYKKSLSEDIKEYLLKGTKKSIISFYERENKSVEYLNKQDKIKKCIDINMFINLNTQDDLREYKGL